MEDLLWPHYPGLWFSDTEAMLSLQHTPSECQGQVAPAPESLVTESLTTGMTAFAPMCSTAPCSVLTHKDVQKETEHREKGETAWIPWSSGFTGQLGPDPAVTSHQLWPWLL